MHNLWGTYFCVNLTLETIVFCEILLGAGVSIFLGGLLGASILRPEFGGTTGVDANFYVKPVPVSIIQQLLAA